MPILRTSLRATSRRIATPGNRPGVRKHRTDDGAPIHVEELLLRDKASLDVFWLKDASMTDLENLPEPEVLADEIS